MSVNGQVMEAAFKNETVGLVTREEFLNKRNTLKDRMDKAAAKAKREAERVQEQVRDHPAAALLH